MDDNATNRQILMLQAEEWGMLATTAESGFEALELCRTEPSRFDMAIVDMQMPEMDGLTLGAEIHKLPDYHKFPLIMLSSIGKPETGDRASGDFAAQLTKPVKQSHLYNVLIHILGGQPIQVKSSRSSVTQINRHLAEELPLRILLAEDNKVNQKVALHILKTMGYTADIANNGLEALSALHRQPYDVVLMDMQMPEMDGLEATRRICQEWAAAARPRIIAMTANAMQGDKEACLKAGMDDYVSKPIRIDDLVKALSKCQPGSSVISSQIGSLEQPTTQNKQMTNDLPAIDAKVLQSFRKMLGKNTDEIVAEMIDCYLEDAPKLLGAIATAFGESNPQQLLYAAHTLKSSSATLGAKTLSKICKELELAARNGNIESEADKVPQLEAEFERVKAALQIEAGLTQKPAETGFL